MKTSSQPPDGQRAAEPRGEAVTIYVALFDEGVDVWRPVAARRLPGNRYAISEAAPGDEIWQFPPGSIVRCEEGAFADGKRGQVAVEIVPIVG